MTDNYAATQRWLMVALLAGILERVNVQTGDEIGATISMVLITGAVIAAAITFHLALREKSRAEVSA